MTTPELRNRTVAAIALAATYLFWIEYLPPFSRAHLYSDIDGFHWPLLVYAFEAVRHGRFPLWDPSIYCGMPFAGNIQAGFFYPPVWLLFAANIFSRHVLFKSLEAWVFLHVWAAFCLCYLWLRGRGRSCLASTLGGAVFAFGGYMVSQAAHVGVVTGYCWTPLAWLGIDQAVRSSSWRPLWKVTAASALCLLAGYPPSFAAFAVATVVYGTARAWRYGVATTAAITASLLLCAVQLLSAEEASALKTFDPKYGPGIHDPLFYLQFIVPDWVGLQFGDSRLYLYLGAPALFGLFWFRAWRDRAVLAVLVTCALLMTNPFDVISGVLSRSHVLVQIFTPHNFIEPATLAFAFIAASGIDAFLFRPHSKTGAATRLATAATAAALVAWSVFQMMTWPKPSLGLRSAAETAVMLLLFTLALYLVRNGRAWMTVLLFAAVFVDYKAGGTSRPFSTLAGDLDPYFPRRMMRGVDPHVYDILREHRDYRIATDAINPTEFRRYGLATPQGFDPLVSEQYKTSVERYKPFRTNRLFDLAPPDERLARLLGVRYFLTREAALPPFSGYRLIGRGDTVFHVFENPDALPSWRWTGSGRAAPVRWEPERREFQVEAGVDGGALVLVEQFYPGWRASIDGKPVPIRRSEGAFQAIGVPPGSHVVAFEYRPASVAAGAAISTASLIAFAGWLWATRRRHSYRSDI